MSQERPDADASPASAILFPANYFRRFEEAYPVGDGVMTHESIIATPEEWISRPESGDPSWEIKRDAYPLVVATRAMG